jgi:hypothetical protein
MILYVHQRNDLINEKNFEKLDDGQDYKTEHEYRIMAKNKEKYTGTLLFVGTMAECEQFENDMYYHNVDKGLKNKINKGPTPKAVVESDDKVRLENEIEVLKTELSVVKRKLEESEIQVGSSNKEILKLRDQLKDANDKLTSLASTKTNGSFFIIFFVFVSRKN